MFEHFLELSHRDGSNKWSNIGFSIEIGIIEINICSLSGILCNINDDDVDEKANGDDVDVENSNKMTLTMMMLITKLRLQGQLSNGTVL